MPKPRISLIFIAIALVSASCIGTTAKRDRNVEEYAAGNELFGDVIAERVAARAPLADAKLLPENGGVHIGAYVVGGNDQDRRNQFENYEATLRRPMDVAQEFVPPHQFERWPLARIRWHADQGRIPLITFRPPGTAAAVNRGERDGAIRAAARQAKQIPGQWYARLAHEMDGRVTGAQLDVVNGDGPERFKAMWRRIHRIFAEEGVTGAVWTFTPATWNRTPSPERFYPGDRWVGWIGADSYDAPNCREGHRSMEQAMGAEFWRFSDAHPTKPVMLAEWGASANLTSSQRADFYKSLGETMGRHPRLAAVVSFESSANSCSFRSTHNRVTIDAMWMLVNDPIVTEGRRS